MELDVGDHISLVKKSKIPEKERHLCKKLEYELCRLDGEDMAAPRNLPGEILVQTTTESIIIDDDSDTDESVKVKKVEKQPLQNNGSTKMETAAEKKFENFGDDYEEGEPSRTPRPPTPPKTDPVSIVSLNIYYFFPEIFGYHPAEFRIIN